MKKNTFFQTTKQTPPSPVHHARAKEGSEQKGIAQQPASTAKRSEAKREEASKHTAIQYNMFTTEFCDIVNSRGNIIAVKMTSDIQQKYFPKTKKHDR